MYSWWCILCSSQLAGRRRRSPAEQNRLTISVPSMSAASYHRNQWLWGWSERLEVNDHVTKAAWNMSSTTPCITDIQLFMLNSDCLGDNGDKSVKFLLMWGKKNKKTTIHQKDTPRPHNGVCLFVCSHKPNGPVSPGSWRKLNLLIGTFLVPVLSASTFLKYNVFWM